MTDETPNGIPFSKKLTYALPAFSLAVIGIPIYVYLPKFYTDVVGIDIASLGIILFSVRIFDAVTDPVIGFLSDRSHSRYGRRRPYIAVGSVFVVLTMFLLFNPPIASRQIETLWFAFFIYGLFLFWTVTAVPYESLGPEITFDYHDRTSLFAFRDGLLIAGTLAAASSPAIVKWLFDLSGDAVGERAKFFWISVIYAPIILITCWWCAAAIKEIRPKTREVQGSLWQGLRQVSRNRPFVILLAAYTISAIGNNLPATLILYYVQYVLQSDLADLFLLIYFVSGIMFLPVWIMISRRTGKKIAWLSSMAINTGAFIGVFFLGPGDALIYGALVFVSGIGFGATLAIPSAIQADVIDYDELLTGERREGQYIGLWSIAKKLAAAMGVGIGLSVLGMVGYTPNVEQPESVRLALRTLYALVPSVCNIIAFGLATSYPISGQKHQEIRIAIERRRAGQLVENPLEPSRVLS